MNAGSAEALRAEAERIDREADENLAWAARAFGRGLNELGKGLEAFVEVQTRQASILREDAAWLEERWGARA